MFSRSQVVIFLRLFSESEKTETGVKIPKNKIFTLAKNSQRNNYFAPSLRLIFALYFHIILIFSCPAHRLFWRLLCVNRWQKPPWHSLVPPATGVVKVDVVCLFNLNGFRRICRLIRRIISWKFQLLSFVLHALRFFILHS